MFDTKEMLRRLGAGEPIEAVCAAAGLSRAQFDAWWRQETARRVPPVNGSQHAAVTASVRIDRDRWGIPHIQAGNDRDLFFGFGYAQAQDRLFQLDILRRRGSGRLSEVLGAEGNQLDLLLRTVGFQNIFELDLLARTVGLRRIAEAEWLGLSGEVQGLLQAFSDGVNAVIDESKGRLPIEFDLLEYQPGSWSPVDCLTIENEFRWYLTGRFPVIVIPELARRALGDGPLYRAFLQNESDEESILLPGEYSTRSAGVQSVGEAIAEPEAATGSNNWVLGGTRTVSGRPIVASDPHIAFDAVSCWWQVHLRGGSFHTAGMAYTGMPAVMFGRNERVAWGCTNNICSQRDLYQEKTDAAHPHCFLYDGRWEPARCREEVIHVKGGPPVCKTIRFSRNGPIVDEILPPPARGTGPVSLKWLGAHAGGWLTALLDMDRAPTAAAFREASRPWHVPTFSLVFADADGHIGYQCAGRIPVRHIRERGYRPGWDPAHQWAGLIPFEGMPAVQDPPRGWMATANNRPAPDDFPYPLSGTWSDGLRAARIREMIEAAPSHTRKDVAAMQHDVVSPRARRCLPHVIALAARNRDPRFQDAVQYLKDWDGRMECDIVGPTIFSVFFACWARTVARERFEGDAAGLLTGAAAGLAARLLVEDWCGWFDKRSRETAFEAALQSALDLLTNRLGPDMGSWTWGRIHVMPLRHVLSGRGDLAQLLDAGGIGVRGDMTTVCNTGFGSSAEARSGAGYRLIVDFGEVSGIWAADGQSQSGHPGSPHYADQYRAWLAGEYHFIAMDENRGTKQSAATLLLSPQ